MCEEEVDDFLVIFGVDGGHKEAVNDAPRFAAVESFTRSRLERLQCRLDDAVGRESNCTLALLERDVDARCHTIQLSKLQLTNRSTLVRIWRIYSQHCCTTFCGSRSILRLLPPSFPRTRKATWAIESGATRKVVHKACINSARTG